MTTLSNVNKALISGQRIEIFSLISDKIIMMFRSTQPADCTFSNNQHDVWSAFGKCLGKH